MTGVEVVAALLMLAGLVGIVVPVLPGLVLVLAGVLLWATEQRSAVGWTVLGISVAVVAAGWVAKYLLPGRRLKQAGVPWRTTAAGVVLGVVGFFVVPVVGLVLGFVLGIYLAERLRLRTHAAAWPSTVHALRAVGWSMLIELTTAMLVIGTWVAGVLAT